MTFVRWWNEESKMKNKQKIKLLVKSILNQMSCSNISEGILIAIKIKVIVFIYQLGRVRYP